MITLEVQAQATSTRFGLVNGEGPTATTGCIWWGPYTECKKVAQKSASHYRTNQASGSVN